MSGIDLNFIRRSTAVVTDDGAYLGNVQITKTVQFANHQGRGPGGRVCPECLLEDREFTEGPLDCRPFRRFWWDFAEFHGCPRHRRALIDTCPGCMQPLEKNSLRPDYCFCGFDLALAPPGDGTEEVAERSLLSILFGGPSPDWAKDMSLRAMSGLALRVGVVHVFGPEVSAVGSFSIAERMQLLALGWTRMAGCADAFSQLLSQSLELGSPASPGLAYGEVYRWLKRTDEPGLDRYRKALGEHAAAHLKVHRDREIFGTIVTAKRLSSRSRCYDEMRKLLSLSKGQRKRFIQTNKDYRLPRDPAHAHSKVEELRASLARIERDRPHYAAIPEGQVQVMELGPFGRLWPDVVLEIQSGRLPLSGVLANQVGLYRWLVDLKVIGEHMPRPLLKRDALTYQEAAERLGLQHKALRAVRRAGLLSHDTSIRSGRATKFLSLASIEAFERNFVTGRYCADLCGLHTEQVRAILNDSAVDRPVPGRLVYPRDKALEVLRDILGRRDRSSV